MAGKRQATGTKPKGTGLRWAGKNGPQLAKTDGNSWTDEAEAMFLDRLAASCNVRTAAEAIGYTTPTLYWRRRRDPAFAERWQAALEQGYVRLEALLLSNAEDALSGHMPDPETPFASMTVKEAMELLRMHHATARGRVPGAPGRPSRLRSLEEVHGSIMAKLSSIDDARTAVAPGAAEEPNVGAG
ncbi:MAG TPA: hypothetical protein VF636_10930 [Sphingomonas sp.]